MAGGTRLGALVATGSRSSVFEWGRDAVAKVPDAATPDQWIRYEAEISRAVWQGGAPVPEFLGFEHHDDRLVSIYRRARGPVLWNVLGGDPAAAERAGWMLADLQARLAVLPAPVVVPRQRDRVSAKIRAAARRVGRDLLDALSAIPPVQEFALCHGDMHPSNVILTDDGPVIVDWFDASRGDPVADVARSLLLLTPPGRGATAARHLDHVPAELVDRALVAYRSAAIERRAIDTEVLERWHAVLAVARIAEGVDPDGLVAVWRRWQARNPRGTAPGDSGDGVAEVVEDDR